MEGSRLQQSGEFTVPSKAGIVASDLLSFQEILERQTRKMPWFLNVGNLIQYFFKHPAKQNTSVDRMKPTAQSANSSL